MIFAPTVFFKYATFSLHALLFGLFSTFLKASQRAVTFHFNAFSEPTLALSSFLPIPVNEKQL